MRLPIQAPPTIRKVSTAKILDMMAGVNLSNWQLQCALCCEIGGGAACNTILPGCVCPL
jgi:hypothetical protein